MGEACVLACVLAAGVRGRVVAGVDGGLHYVLAANVEGHTVFPARRKGRVGHGVGASTRCC